MPVCGRVVFSSSEDLTRATRAKVAEGEEGFVSWVSTAAESLFATLFPSDCRLCGSPLTKISRLPVCETCLSEVRALGDGACAVCGERLTGHANRAHALPAAGNVRGAFLVKRPAELKKREGLLVDDVLTTGTTASECARVLRRAGATRVGVATVARTMKAETSYGLINQDSDETEERMAMAANG